MNAVIAQLLIENPKTLVKLKRQKKIITIGLEGNTIP